jgi:SAM-dependent methyltransferase
MNTWNEGYVTDIDYVSGFTPEMTPVMLSTTATLLGYRTPDLDQPYAYADLGCGQGFGTALMAAANPIGRFWGFDFNPGHVASGRRMAAAACIDNVEFDEASFVQLAESSAGRWPEFDFIVLHGVYSWVSRANQLAIIEFIRRFLKPGGLVYLGYNCAPGWSSMVPLQRLIRRHADDHPARSDLQAQQALGFVERLREGGARYFGAHPGVAERLATTAKMDSHYLAHEYLNRDWQILDFAAVAQDCVEAKLDYLGSACLVENLDHLSAPAGLLPLLAESSDTVLHQSLLDFASNKGFRRDIFQKGLARLTAREHAAAVRRICLLPLALPSGGGVDFVTPNGMVSGRPELYQPLMQGLAQGEMTLGDMAARAEMAGQTQINLVEVAILLISAGHVAPKANPLIRPATAAALNRFILAEVMNGRQLSYLAAPALGSAIEVNFVDMVAASLLVETPGLSKDAFVSAGWQRLLSLGRRLTKDGVVLSTEADSMQELAAVFSRFQQGRTALWRELGILGDLA